MSLFIGDRRRDILTGIMRTRGRMIILPILILALMGALALLGSGASLALGSTAPLQTVSRLQIITPTPAPQEGSTAGSTDGIMWMGAAIVVIILLPVLLKMSTLTRS